MILLKKARKMDEGNTSVSLYSVDPALKDKPNNVVGHASAPTIIVSACRNEKRLSLDIDIRVIIPENCVHNLIGEGDITLVNVLLEDLLNNRPDTSPATRIGVLYDLLTRLGAKEENTKSPDTSKKNTRVIDLGSTREQ
jgi:hypothetical protein